MNTTINWKTFVTACLAYIGYAVGGLLIAVFMNVNAGDAGADPIQNAIHVCTLFDKQTHDRVLDCAQMAGESNFTLGHLSAILVR